MNSNTDFLFVKPSFLNGVARSIDIFGLFTEYNFNFSKTEEEDYKALLSDYLTILNDANISFRKMKKNFEKAR